MEEKGSFIPKKTLAKPVYVGSGVGLFLSFSFLMIVISGLLFGGAYLYKGFLEKNNNEMLDSLKRAQDILDPVFIQEMQTIDTKIESSKVLLGQHRMPSALFEFLEQSTLESVRFSNFDFSFPSQKDENVIVNLRGTAKGYSSLALQAREFQNNKYVENVIFSGLSLGEKGVINFSAKVIIDTNFLAYQVKQ